VPRVWALDGSSLLAFLKRRPPLRVYAHLLSGPFLRLLVDIGPELVVLDDKPENRAAAEALRRAGVRVYKLRALHAKVFVGEDYVAVGSANPTERALRNYEVVVVIEDGVEAVPGLAKIISAWHARMEPWW